MGVATGLAGVNNPLPIIDMDLGAGGDIADTIEPALEDG